MNKNVVLSWYIVVNITFIAVLILLITLIEKNIIFLLFLFVILASEIYAIFRLIELIKTNPNINSYRMMLRKKDEEIENLKKHNEFLIKSALNRSKKYEDLSKYAAQIELKHDKIKKELEKIKTNSKK